MTDFAAIRRTCSRCGEIKSSLGGKITSRAKGNKFTCASCVTRKVKT